MNRQMYCVTETRMQHDHGHFVMIHHTVSIQLRIVTCAVLTGEYLLRYEHELLNGLLHRRTKVQNIRYTTDPTDCLYVHLLTSSEDAPLD